MNRACVMNWAKIKQDPILIIEGPIYIYNQTNKFMGEKQTTALIRISN